VEKQPEVLRSLKVSVSKLNTIMQSTTVYIMLQNRHVQMKEAERGMNNFDEEF